jgi:hypothetical protein
VQVHYAIFTTFQCGKHSDFRTGMYLILLLHTSRTEFSSDPLPKISEIASQDQNAYAETWKKPQPSLTILFEPSIQGAIGVARNIGKTKSDTSHWEPAPGRWCSFSPSTVIIGGFDI